MIEVSQQGVTVRLKDQHRPYAECDLSRPEVFSQLADSLDHHGFIDCSRTTIHRYKNGLTFLISGLPEFQCDINDYLAHLCPGDLVFDLGAYCGVSTYHFAQVASRVIAVEPDPISFGCLESNCNRYELRNVTLINGAVAVRSGYEHFNAEGNMGSALFGVSSRQNFGIEVRTHSLHSLVQQYGTPDLIKMDIEGSEIEVLESAVGLLGQMKTRIVLDTNHVVYGKKTTNRVESALKSAGYQVRSSDVCTWGWKN